MNIKVLGARLVVKELKNDVKTAGGVIIPGREKEQTNRGEVIAIGDGAMLDDGRKVPMQVKVGDTIAYASFAGSPIEIDGQVVLILNERDILCIFE